MVLIYNGIWFALPIIALALCVVDPAAARATIEAAERWARRHSRPILLAVSFGVGALLVVRGALAY
jgi:hypothetical protein